LKICFCAIPSQMKLFQLLSRITQRIYLKKETYPKFPTYVLHA
jgi:hypothetical protein